MFKRSRRKIIVSIMASLILLFIITLTVIMLASYRELRLRDAGMLDRFAEMYVLEQQDGGPESPQMKPGRPEFPPVDEKRDFQLSTFYSVEAAGSAAFHMSSVPETDIPW